MNLKLYLKTALLCIFLSVLDNLTAHAEYHDGDTFTVGISENDEIVYKIISEAQKTCQVGTGDELCIRKIKSFTYAVEELSIPNQVNGYTVIRIGESAFKNSYLKNAIIPETVTSIGESAFERCYSLESITIPNSVINIGNKAFYYCRDLKNFIIPNSVTSIGEYAFYGCNNIENVTIPESMTTIGSKVFYDCEGLTYVSIPNSVTSIGDSAFVFCKITSITIPNSVTSIGRGAFQDCSKLSSVTLSNSITTIKNDVFSGCTSLTNVDIPGSVTRIGASAFQSCGLTNVTIPSSVITIEEDAFSMCYDLKKVVIGDIVAWLNINLANERSNPLLYGAHLYNLDNLEIQDLIIPNGVTSIGSKIFYRCNGLKSVVLPESLTAIGDSAFAECCDLTNITMPSSLATIGESAFDGCENLANVTLPASLTSIGIGAFYNCKSFTNITIPNSITSIEGKVFMGCENLSNITIPETVKSIGWSAFAHSGLTSINIPNSVTSIGSSAFYWCMGLKSINIGKNVTSIDYYAFSGCRGIESFVVEEGNPKYDSRDNCNALIETETNTLITGFNVSKIPSTITSIEHEAFTDMTSLTTIFIPSSVTSIGSYAFGDCTGLTKVISDNKTPSPISSGAFNTLNATLYVPFGTQSKYEATEGWNRFDEIVEYVNDGDTFTAKTVEGVEMTFKVISAEDKTCKVTECAVPETVTGKVTIPGQVEWITITTISARAFSDRTGLTEVVIPGTVTAIGEEAFFGCTGLKGITSEIEEPFAINSNVFQNNNGESLEATLYVPISAYSLYKDTEGWNHFADIIGNLQDEEVFFAETKEGVEMTFKVISAVDRTCQVGSSEEPCVQSSTEGEVTIPNQVYGFSVTEISKSAFNACTGLTEVSIPNSVTSIEHNAFDNCISLKDVDIPGLVTSINDGAFTDCKSLTSITIPSSVTFIGENAFLGCAGLDSVTSEIENPFAIGNSVFEGISNSATLYVPEGTKSKYATTEGWNRFANIEELWENTDISQLDNVLYIDGAEAIPDGGRATLVVKMRNNVVAEGFHFTLRLPEGCSFALNDEGKPNVELARDRTNSSITNRLDTTLIDDRNLEVEAYSTKGKTIDGNDGPVVLVRINVAEGTKVGPHPLKLMNWGVTDNFGTTWPQGNKSPVFNTLSVLSLMRGNANDDDDPKINTGDFITIAHYILNLPYNKINKTAADVNGDGNIDVGDLTGTSNLKKYGTIYRPNTSNSPKLVKVMQMEVE